MSEAQEPKIYILYENEDWFLPLAQALEARELPYEGMKVIEGGVSLDKEPPKGVFFNRLSASSHTRGHTGSIPLGGAILTWLEHYGRRVVNGRDVLDMEVRKFDQYARLQAAGIDVPRTIATTGKTSLIGAAEAISKDSGGPFIVKPNRGGKGLGVRLFEGVDALKKAVELEETDFISVDGIQLVQEYIESKNNRILRNEYIGGKHYYSVEVNTEEGFELCPADACCIIDAPKQDQGTGEKFKILKGFEHPLNDKFESFMDMHALEVAAFETIEDQNGKIYCYDINTNTNYNTSAEVACETDVDAYGRVAEFLGGLYHQTYNERD